MAGVTGEGDDCGHAPRFASIAQELDGVLHVLESALEISRAEAGIGRANFEQVDIAAMLRDLQEIYEPLALEAAREGDDVRLSVSDRAQGIPPHQREEALRKFGRLDKARNTPGSGLGLTLVSAVASLHGGRFELQDNGPGLRAELVLPCRL